jgi:hypothetical protein
MLKNKLLPSCCAWMALTGLILGTSPGFAQTATNITVQSLSQIQTLTASPPANYGTPDPATFADKPFTVKSGTGAELFGGTPSAPAADTVLLVLSATSAGVASLGIIGLKFDGLPAVSFAASDFFTTAQTGFPTKVMSIANGTVNGIGFPDALHAAADITFSGPVVAGADLGTVTITSPINLRVDVFGDIFNTTAGHDTIVGNAANSGAEGVTPAPEPSPMALFGVATVGLVGVMLVRHRRHHCTSA